MRQDISHIRHPFRVPRVTASAWNVGAPAPQRGAAGAVASSSAAAESTTTTCGQQGPPAGSNPNNDNNTNNKNAAAACGGGDIRDKDACGMCYETEQFVYGSRCLLCNCRTVHGPGASHLVYARAAGFVWSHRLTQ
ncbi:hypothetical protein CYMTET_23786 [Cymbomonas tetramitiformis]|uniref:Uncharacterized protein n=1 Tax=Cymbomonas tetramitiformis TaxID=36881 RepID=A0AAE0FX93_9CHLO|nr:hypothetical protein CYMTET_23786 [Cymbomonas tetramitiformis]